jgi:predicted nucleotidyltransferase
MMNVRGRPVASRSSAQRAGERERVLGLLRTHVNELRALGIRGLSLFGSVARDEALPESDVDLLVDLDSQTELGFGVVGLRDDLDRRVGLSFVSRLRPELRQRIERDLVRVF